MIFPHHFQKENHTFRSAFAKLLVPVFIVSLCSACQSETGKLRPETSRIFAMDTYMELTAYGDGAASALEEAGQMLTQLDKLLDRTSPESAASAINHSNGKPVSIDPILHELLSASLSCGAFTQGKFDISIAPLADLWGFTKDAFRVPSPSEIASTLPFVGPNHIQLSEHEVILDPGTEIDFGGIAKGLAVEQAYGIFTEKGVQHALANLGGDLLVLGNKPDGESWRIGIQSPFAPNDPTQYAGILTASDVYVLTSGSYERYFEENDTVYHHIIDPFTGSPSSNGLASVTVVTDLQPGYGQLCDALSTALFTMTPEDAIAFWREHSSLFQMILISDRGEIWMTDGLEGHFLPSASAPFTHQIIH